MSFGKFDPLVQADYVVCLATFPSKIQAEFSAVLTFSGVAVQLKNNDRRSLVELIMPRQAFGDHSFSDARDELKFPYFRMSGGTCGLAGVA